LVGEIAIQRELPNERIDVQMSDSRRLHWPQCPRLRAGYVFESLVAVGVHHHEVRDGARGDPGVLGRSEPLPDLRIYGALGLIALPRGLRRLRAQRHGNDAVAHFVEQQREVERYSANLGGRAVDSSQASR
jgi:hypothetical protein